VWMGYPNRRVSMTSVHGELQQGGALPAVIWHDYMGPATEGHPCAPLNTSNAGISFQPFYGKYATTGRYEAEAAAPKKRGGHHTGRSRSGARAPSGGAPSEPKAQSGEPPPQEAPETPAEPPGGNQAVQPSGGAGPGK
jgi:membrane peptidoglycan carboxypeptidase